MGQWRRKSYIFKDFIQNLNYYILSSFSENLPYKCNRKTFWENVAIIEWKIYYSIFLVSRWIPCIVYVIIWTWASYFCCLISGVEVNTAWNIQLNLFNNLTASRRRFQRVDWAETIIPAHLKRARLGPA